MSLEEDVEKLKEKNDMLMLAIQDLEATNNNLVLATWRERDLKKQVQETLDELEKTKEVIERQNKSISDSINYARNIQRAINPSEEDLKRVFAKSVMYYRPKDIVSGDFPWMYKKGKIVYLAAIDCTGHGVPGAMMSMIGGLLLNDITNNPIDLMPGQMLDNLHKMVVKTLKQAEPGNTSSDGMDIGLCKIDFDRKMISYSGAHRPLIYIDKNKEIIESKGDKYPIGGVQYKKLRKPFVNTTIPFSEISSFYVFSDGFPDQHGGEKGKKYSKKRFIQLLEDNKHLDVNEIGTIIQQSFENWMDGHKQIDDVLLLGVDLGE